MTYRLIAELSDSSPSGDAENLVNRIIPSARTAGERNVGIRRPLQIVDSSGTLPSTTSFDTESLPHSNSDSRGTPNHIVYTLRVSIIIEFRIRSSYGDNSGAVADSVLPDPGVCPLLGCTESLPDILREIRLHSSDFAYETGSDNHHPLDSSSCPALECTESFPEIWQDIQSRRDFTFKDLETVPVFEALARAADGAGPASEEMRTWQKFQVSS